MPIQPWRRREESTPLKEVQVELQGEKTGDLQRRVGAKEHFFPEETGCEGRVVRSPAPPPGQLKESRLLSLSLCPPGPEADLGAPADRVHRRLLPVPGHSAPSPAHLKCVQVGPANSARCAGDWAWLYPLRRVALGERLEGCFGGPLDA